MLTIEQQKKRQNCIGGSDMAIILGLSKYKTPYQLWCEKKGIIEPTLEQTQLQYWGSQIEPLIRQEFSKRNNVDVETPQEAITHPFFNHLSGNLDGFIPAWNSIFEAKCSHAFMSSYWGDDGSNIVPLEYLVQVAFYTSIMNADSAHIAVLIGGNDYREFKYYRDLELERTILDAACAFWVTVQNDLPPPATAMVDIKIMYPQHTEGKTIAANSEISEYFSKIVDVKAQLKKLQEIENDYKFKIVNYMADAECLVDADGKPLATYKTSKKGSRTFLPKGEK